MPVVFIHEFPIGDRSTDNYDYIVQQLAAEPIDGLLVHTAGFDDEAGVWRQIDVWETREQAERFLREKMTSITSLESLPRPDTGMVPPTREASYELHGFLKY